MVTTLDFPNGNWLAPFINTVCKNLRSSLALVSRTGRSDELVYYGSVTFQVLVEQFQKDHVI